ncbi:MAG: type II toxin-antitoxin system HicA family toxin [Nanoarchaeota archaeon]
MKLQSMKGKDLIILLKKAGFKVVGERGGHISLRKGVSRLIIPSHEDLSEKTLENLIEQANLSSKDMAALLAGEELPQEQVIEAPLEEDVEDVPIQFEGNFAQRAWYASTRAFPLALIRVIVGILFLTTAFETAPWLGPSFGWYADSLDTLVRFPAYGITTSFIISVAQPNIVVFGWLHFLLNLFIGLSLLVGFFGKFWSAVGFFWSLHMFLLRTDLLALRSINPAWWVWSDILLASVLFLFFTMNASRTFGIDQKLSELCESKKDGSWFWRCISVFV